MKKPFSTILFLFFCIHGFSQKIIIDRTSTDNLLDMNSKHDINISDTSISSFGENIYWDSSTFYNQLKPLIKPGEFLVLVSKDGLEYKVQNTKHLENLSIDKIEEFRFVKSALYDTLYGDFAQKFGVVMIKLK